jgi:hypothetical protein
MDKELQKEIETRRQFVEQQDAEMHTKNIGHFRAYWLNMVILSSAIAVGVLPILDSESSHLIKSPTLTKLGLLLITIVCLAIIIYFQKVLTREKSLLSEQTEFHKYTFFMQSDILNKAIKDGKDESYLKELLGRTKVASFRAEQNIIAKYVVGKRFIKMRSFINKYFNQFVSYGFSLGVILVILSFIIDK